MGIIHTSDTFFQREIIFKLYMVLLQYYKYCYIICICYECNMDKEKNYNVCVYVCVQKKFHLNYFVYVCCIMI